MTKKKTPSNESKAKKALRRQEESRRGRQEEIDCLGEDEDYRGQGRFYQSSPGENTENQIQGCCVQILESRKPCPNVSPAVGQCHRRRARARYVRLQAKPNPNLRKTRGRGTREALA